MEFQQKIKQFSEKFHMLWPQAGVLVGLSGGADSVALLEVLCQMREALGLRLFAVHVNHSIRDTAQKDADFCEALCKAKKVDFVCEKVDVLAIAKEQGMTVEEAGRIARYEIFEHYRLAQGLDVIAVAHHKNDQAETMLFQLFRGSGVRGLAGIPYYRDRIVRPLLAVTREEIETFLQKGGLGFVVDETNAEDAYSRNKIRHHILPVAEEICPGAVEHMTRAGMLLREVQDFLNAESDTFLKEYAHHEEAQIWIPVEALKTKHIALQKIIILSAMEQIVKSQKDITEKHVEGVLALLEKAGEKYIALPKGCFASKQYDSLIFGEKEICPKNEAMHAEEILVKPGQKYLLPDGQWLETTLITNNNLENIPKSNCTKWFDYDRISHALLIRTRQTGDYLTIDEKGSKKSLQDYFVNEKVPKSMRDEMLLLADGQHIVWVLDRRISSHYKVTKSTKQILQVHLGGTKDDRENRSND